MTKIPSVEAFWKMLEATQFVKRKNIITDKVEEGDLIDTFYIKDK